MSRYPYSQARGVGGASIGSAKPSATGARATTTESLPTQCVAIIGLGYVGLHLATGFGRIVSTVGFDIDPRRIHALRHERDQNGDVSPKELKAPHLRFTDNPEALTVADCFIVAVPTPVDQAKRPDLSYLVEASRLVARVLRARRLTRESRSSKKPVVIYESTVYPGCTEEVCVPVLERESGLIAGRGFHVGYSPERINPGDSEHSLETVIKVVSAQDAETLELVGRIYGLVAKAGICKASDIRTAEAAKVIENVQRDLNIALMNDLAMLFHRMGLSTRETLRVARTKWNFLPFEPGLVGGHCIPVDPYYLTHKAQELGYHPAVILAGRRTNDGMGIYVAQQTIKLLIRAGKTVQGARVLVLGVAFKEDVRDVRNSRVVDLLREMEGYGCQIHVHEPVVGAEPLERLGLRVVEDPFEADISYDAVVLAVPHRTYREKRPEAYIRLLKTVDGRGVLVDVRGVLFEKWKPMPGVLYWNL